MMSTGPVTHVNVNGAAAGYLSFEKPLLRIENEIRTLENETALDKRHGWWHSSSSVLLPFLQIRLRPNLRLKRASVCLSA